MVRSSLHFKRSRAEIKFTTDGSDPREHGGTYESPFLFQKELNTYKQLRIEMEFGQTS